MKKYAIGIAEFDLVLLSQLPAPKHLYLVLAVSQMNESNEENWLPLESLHGLATHSENSSTYSAIKEIFSTKFAAKKKISYVKLEDLFDGAFKHLYDQNCDSNHSLYRSEELSAEDLERIVPEILGMGQFNDYLQAYHIPHYRNAENSSKSQFSVYWLKAARTHWIYGNQKDQSNDSVLTRWRALT